MLHMYVCMYVYIFIYTYIHTYTYLYIPIHMFVQPVGVKLTTRSLPTWFPPPRINPGF